jgi:hypothetical protein
VASTSRVDFSQDQVHALLASASRGGPDFVVATLTPQPGLAIIRDGAVHEGSNQAYVGEPQANDQFQKALDRIGGPGESVHGFGPLTRAMDEVITSNVVPTVGDLVTEVRCTDFGFRYTGHGIVSTGPFDLSDDSADPATWGSAAAGGYYESYLYPRDAGIGALGVYFYQIRLGALFYPAKAERAIPYTDVSHQDFVTAVRVDHGIELAGSRIEAGPGRNFVLH